MILGFAQIGIDGTFTAHESDVCLTGEDSGHGLVSTEAGDKGKVDAFLFKIAIFHGCVHGSIEDRVGYLVQSDL